MVYYSRVATAYEEGEGVCVCVFDWAEQYASSACSQKTATVAENH